MTKRRASMTPAELDREREYAKAYYAANRDRLREYQRDRYARPPAEARARSREWRAANPEERRKAVRRWNAANPEKKATQERKRKLKAAYGLSVEQYDRKYAEQSGACAVCGYSFAGQARRPAIDHCHNTGRVRALLCSRCNTAMGLARECPRTLRKLAEYLEHHQGRAT